jgi:hypothetical protein
VPRGGDALALAIRLCLPGLRRPASQLRQDPGALPVYRLSAADIGDRRNDFRSNQDAAVHLVSRHDTQLCVLNVCRPQACDFSTVIPEIDIWRAATLMLKRYGDRALEQSDRRVDELTAAGDHDGADTWRRITAAVVQLSNTTPSGPLH